MFPIRLFLSLLVLLATRKAAGQSVDSLHAQIEVSYDQQKPTTIPVMRPLSRPVPYFDGGLYGKMPDSTDYQSGGDGSFIKHNGASVKKFVISTGVWRLLAGDRPVIGVALRDTSGAYARPSILPHIAVNGTIRIEVISGQSKKFLDDFSSVTAVLSAGTPTWICEDKALGLTLTLTAYPFTNDFGFALTASVGSKGVHRVQLNWHYDDAHFVRDNPSNCEFTYDDSTRIFVGTTSRQASYHNGIVRTTLDGGQDKPLADTLICLWGFQGYDSAAVGQAYQRLQFRPFPSEAWVNEMKRKWFQHWIGRGLEPEKKFRSAQQQASAPITASKQYWRSMRSRIVVKTGDARFDNALQSLGSRLISNFEYPAFTHGTNFMKYGKINCGLYGDDAAGLHDEVASTLQFISGSQDIKGRQRYFEPVFTISSWAEEIDPYFVEQLWYHYRWTGDKKFLIDLWPAGRRALEHFISTSDPLHNGFFTGYYENWNGDGKGRGGSGALWTAMGIRALQAGYDIATLLNDKDWDSGGFQVSDNQSLDNDYRKRYYRYLMQAETAYETRYNKIIGAYASGEWHAPLRNMPGNEESNYAIWRGVGDPFRNYSSLRFIRDNYQQQTPNGVIEYCNKDWPVCWSNHYDSYAEAMSSIASSAMANDINHFWPLLKTAAEKIYTVPECTAIAGGRSQLSLESDQMFLMAVLDNIFGIKPDFGKNLLVIRPSFPDAWKDPEIDIPDVAYTYRKTGQEIRLWVKTPVKRILQAEIPVRQPVQAVFVNGHKTAFDTRPEVNYCRIIVRSDSATVHEVRVVLGPDHFAISGKTGLLVNEPRTFLVHGAKILGVKNTQEAFGTITYTDHSIRVVPVKAGHFTLFAAVNKNGVAWYQPIELTVRDAWSIDEAYQAWGEAKQGPSIPATLLSPAIDQKKRVLRFRLINNGDQPLRDKMEVIIYGHSIIQSISLPPNLSGDFEIPLNDVWPLLSRGTIPFSVKLGNQTQSSHAIDWRLPPNPAAGTQCISLDLRDKYNITLSDLYGKQSFRWRIDYTGAAVGVDWRDTLYADSLGYKLFSAPTSVISYGVLPEQMSPSWWSVPAIPDSLAYPVPFHFIEHRINKKNVLALVNAENTCGIPSRAVIHFDKPLSVDKIYLLTANLTKPCKAYYPAAEIEIIYDSLHRQLLPLIPPYSMPSFVQAFCPDAFPIPLGSVEYKQTMDFDAPGLSVTDLVTDPSLKISEIIIRCVASETAVGIVGLTLLKHKGPDN